MRNRRFLILIGGVFIALAFMVGRASAHADLVDATPAPNAGLDRSPVLIELYFSEPVEGGFSTIEVLDSSGKRVDNDDAAVDPGNPTRATVTVRSLADGVYTVSWRALSLVDSHITTGAYPFFVGDVAAADLAAAAAASQQINISSGEIIFRWMSYLATALLLGGALFRSFVWLPGTSRGGMQLDEAIRTAWRVLAVLAVGVLALAGLIGLLTQAGQVVGQQAVWPWDPAMGRLLFSTRYGVLWLLRFGLALVIAAVLDRPAGAWERWAIAGAAAGILVTFSLNSHAAAEPEPFLPVLGDYLHAFGASIWTGGLVYFIATLLAMRSRPEAERTAAAAELIPRFSRLAIAAVALLGISGMYSAVLRLGSFAALTETLYGRVLLVKSLLALPALWIGGLNLTMTTASMRAAAASGRTGGLVDRFRMLITTEAGLLAVTLIAVSVLTAIPPARSASTTPSLTDRIEEHDLSVSIEVVPGRVGLNTFTVQVLDGGEPLEGLREVALQFTPTINDLPPSEVLLADAGGGLYSAEGAYLSLPDQWQLQVAVRRAGEFDTFVNFAFPVGAAATAFMWNKAAAFLLLVSAVALGLAAHRLLPEGKSALLHRNLPAAGLLLLAVFVFFIPAEAEERYVNPIPPNQGSVLEGQALYRVQCISCHGPAGRGDGPVGLTLQPPPADLYEHTQPGVHPDGRLFEWISFGFGEPSVMPHFENILTAEERWHIVNYIRTFSSPLEEEVTP